MSHAPYPSAPLVAAPLPPSIWRMSDIAVGLGLAGLGFLVLIAGLIVASRVLDAAPDDGTLATALLAAIVTLLFEASLALIVLFLARHRALTGEQLGLAQPGRWRWSLYAVLGAYAVLIVYGLVVLAIERLTGSDLGVLRQGNGLPDTAGDAPLVLAILGVSVVVVAPLAEELFFRAFLFRAVQGRWGLVAGLLFSGLAFSLFHTNVGVAVPFFVIGVLLAWAYHATGSLWTPIAAHATINGIGFIATLAGVSS